jgi:hypothetical protein
MGGTCVDVLYLFNSTLSEVHLGLSGLAFQRVGVNQSSQELLEIVKYYLSPKSQMLDY